MMCKLLERKDVFDYGLTVLELLHMLTMYLRMLEMGEFIFTKQPTSLQQVTGPLLVEYCINKAQENLHVF